MKAHRSNWFAEQRELTWTKRPNGKFLHCSFCGSLNPCELAQALREQPNLRLEEADRKYGWPHKSYVHGSTDSDFWKFYTEHLQDADPIDKAEIEKAMRLTFTFSDNGEVSWRPYQFSQ